MKKWLNFADQLNNINRLAGFIARWSILLMLAIGFWNVIGRYLGVTIGHNLSSNGLIEGQWYLFDLAFLLGLGWTLQRQGHVRVDVLYARWKSKRKSQIDLLGTLLLLLPFALGVMTISIGPAIHSLRISEASPDPHGLPRYIAKLLIPISFLLLSLQGIAETIRHWSELKKDSLIKKLEENKLD